MPYPEPAGKRRRAHSHLRRLQNLREQPDRDVELPDLSDASVFEAARVRQRKARRKQQLESYGVENRDSLTQAESAMSAILDELGWRYNTEHPIRNYILDFYVHAHRMAIEVDGGYHATERQKAKDAERDRWLVSKGYIVARFTNEQVLRFPRRVKATLLERLEPRNPHKVWRRVLPSKSLQGECVSRVLQKISSAVQTA